MPEPNNVPELRRFLGMVNQMSKFTPYIAKKGKPLRDLLSKTSQWLWGSSQKNKPKKTKTKAIVKFTACLSPLRS